MRPLGIREIVDVAPVGRGTPGFGLLGDEVLDEIVAIAAYRAQDVYVVAVLAHVDAETNRVDGALLANVGRRLPCATELEIVG